MKKQLEVLQKIWKYQTFREGQKDIIKNVINNKDTIALLPTGAGKSICFQVPTLTTDGVCIVISPLLSLMNDQVENLKNKGIKALYIDASYNEDELIRLFDNIKFGKIKFLYLSPEKLDNKLIQQKIQELNVCYFAIDEAHCISEWGYDFRPSYLKISILRSLKPKVPLIALTASATKKVLNDIISILDLIDYKVFRQSFYRKNLAYQVFKTENKIHIVERILNKMNGSKIIYTNSRKNAYDISQQLNSLGHKTIYYHGGLTNNEKKSHYKLWSSGKRTTMVATNAFGMGIDKEDVSTVIHLNIPDSIENYFQEAGRAGRNEKKAFAVLLYNKSDILHYREQYKNQIPTIAQIKLVYKKLCNFFQIGLGEKINQEFPFNSTFFCSKYNLPNNSTNYAIRLLTQQNVISIEEKFNRKPNIIFSYTSNEVINYLDRNPKKTTLVQFILRTHTGIFNQKTDLNIHSIAKQLKISVESIINDLKELHDQQILKFDEGVHNTFIKFSTPREDDRTINTVSKSINSFIRLKIKRHEQIISYIENDTICRNTQLLAYFNEVINYKCGICDICVNEKKTAIKPNYVKISEAIIALLEGNKNLDLLTIQDNLNYLEKDITYVLELLLEKNRITLTSQNKFVLI